MNQALIFLSTTFIHIVYLHKVCNFVVTCVIRRINLSFLFNSFSNKKAKVSSLKLSVFCWVFCVEFFFGGGGFVLAYFLELHICLPRARICIRKAQLRMEGNLFTSTLGHAPSGFPLLSVHVLLSTEPNILTVLLIFLFATKLKLWSITTYNCIG